MNLASLKKYILSNRLAFVLLAIGLLFVAFGASLFGGLLIGGSVVKLFGDERRRRGVQTRWNQQ